MSNGEPLAPVDPAPGAPGEGPGLFSPFGGEGAEPVNIVITSGVGQRRNPVTGKIHVHNGVDYAVPVGTPILSIAPGRVVAVFRDHPVNGHAVVIDHRPAGIPFMSSYVHLSRIDVGKGATVARGQLVGLSGGAKGSPGAGRSTGPHLHLTVKRWDGRAWRLVDPLRVIDHRPHRLTGRGPGGSLPFATPGSTP